MVRAMSAIAAETLPETDTDRNLLLLLVLSAARVSPGSKSYRSYIEYFLFGLVA
jgi:hypothetical protein